MSRQLASKLASAGFALALTATFAGPTHAQRMHVNGLIGEPPDTSNWPHPAAPDGNPFPRSTASPGDIAYRDVKVQLGKAVFWDEQLSADNTMACGTCHIPSAGGTDDRTPFLDPATGNLGALGVIPQHLNGTFNVVDYGFINPLSTNIDRTGTGLHTPTMIGAYVNEEQFWDRRAGIEFEDAGGTVIPNFTDWASLEDLVVEPPISPIEMGHEDINWITGNIQAKLGQASPLALVDPATIPPDILWIATAGADYDHIFDKIFHADPQFGGFVGATRERIALVVAHYMRTLIPDQAPIDLGTMTPQMVDGFNILDASGCFLCHSATGAPTLTASNTIADPFDQALTNGQLRNIGFGLVKTPTLRNVGLKKRFFSTGQGAFGANTLDDIIKFYDVVQGGALGLDGSGPGGTLTSAEFKAVRAFLGDALTDPRVKAEKFPFDRPQLASERPEFVFESNEFGVGTPGPSGNTPEIIANMPPLVPKFGPPHFKVGVGDTVGSTPASLLVSTLPGPGPVIWVGPSLGLPMSIVTNPVGIGTIHTPFALTTSLIGVPFHTQWVVHEFGGNAHSNAAKFVPFQF